MKITNKFIYSIAMLGLSSLALTSCSDKDEYSPGDPVSGDQAFFPSSVQTQFNLKEDESTFVVKVSRVDDSQAIDLPITVTPSESNTLSNAFSFPSSVSFSAGSKTADFVVTYNISMFTDAEGNIAYDDEQQFVLKIDESSSTPYGSSTIEITAVYPAPWMLLGTGNYYDEYWGVNDDDDTYEGPIEVTVWQNGINPDLFRIQNPYRVWNGEDTYMQFILIRPGSTVAGYTVPADFPETIVYYPDYFVEYHPTYDDDIYIVFPGRFTSMPNPEDWAHNFVVDWQENGLPGEIHLSPMYYMFNNGGWNHTTDEPITILFPGYESLDTEITVTYNGLLTKADSSLEVEAYIEFGADVTSAKVAIVSGSTPSAAQISAIESGEIASLTLNESGMVNLSFSNESPSGKYSVVALSYYETSMRNYDYSTFQFTQGTPETWSLVGAGLYTYLEFWEQNLGLEPEMLELYESDAVPGKFKITHWFNDQDFVFTLNPDNTIYVEPEQNTGVTAGGAEVWVDDFTDWGDGLYGELEDGIYWFGVIYYNSVSGGYYDYGYESFEPATVENGTRSAVVKANRNPLHKGRTLKFNKRVNFSRTLLKAGKGLQIMDLVSK